MIAHVPGCVEAHPDTNLVDSASAEPAEGLGGCTDGVLPLPSLVGLLEQIRRDIESQTVELKRCIALNGGGGDSPPARASSAPDSCSLKRPLSKARINGWAPGKGPASDFVATGESALHKDVSGMQPEVIQVRNQPTASSLSEDDERYAGGGRGAFCTSLDNGSEDNTQSAPSDCGTNTSATRHRSRGLDGVHRESLNSLAQKAWSHLLKPKTAHKRKKGNKAALRHNSDLEENVFLRVTNHPSYELASAMLILCNALTIALETHHRCRRAMEAVPDTILEDEIHWIVLRDLCCFLFIVELGLRIAAHTWDFFTSDGWEWNVFDFVVVVSAFVEMLVSHAQNWVPLAHSSLLRILRLLRIVRVLRVVSVSRTLGKLLCFQDLRTMAMALCGALKSLLWVVVTMLLIVLIFAIYFTEGAIDRFIHGANDPELDTETLRAKYGGLPTAMLSLLKAITGGEDWADTLEPLEVLPVLYPFVFMVYVLFGTLALMNIVTAVFVDSTIQRSRIDQNYIIQQESFAKKEFIQTMCFIFEELDSDCSGQISLDELRNFVESSTIATYFSALDLNITEVRTLFSLIDVDHSGTIDRDEFIWGCLRLKGEAKSLDLALLQYEMKAMQHSLQDICDVMAPKDASPPQVQHDRDA